MTLTAILHRASRQGQARPWTLRTTKRRIKVRFPADFIRGRMIVADWSRVDGLNSKGVA